MGFDHTIHEAISFPFICLFVFYVISWLKNFPTDILFQFASKRPNQGNNLLKKWFLRNFFLGRLTTNIVIYLV